MEAARRIAHTLKGTGTSYGFPQVTEAGRAVLKAADADLGAATDELLETLRRVARSAEDPAVSDDGGP